ncbi:MAG TPA: PadR family transcriptional regulator [Tepidisphaeraceae bacterium]|nr:PadR family transcriptional regulator [Tepidisphaeraceae bacterium]
MAVPSPALPPDVPQDLVKGSIVPIVLALLGERPRYGYEIVKLVDARSNGLLKWKEGTLYPTLHKLEADGLVQAEWRDAAAAEGGRPRKYYALTRAGRAELATKAGQWRAFAAAVNAVLGPA